MSINPCPGGLSSTPPDRQGRGLTCGIDTDPEGRQGGGPNPDDFNGDQKKDVLPAYEYKGGPPNYNKFLCIWELAQTRGCKLLRLHPVERLNNNHSKFWEQQMS